MKNTFGNNVSVTLFGESHGPAVGCVIDGLAPGIKIDEQFIKDQLSLRRPVGKISTARVEQDNFSILSGVFNGYTTGTPLCITIPNENTKSKDYSETRYLARPSHADYTSNCKYHGFEDYRGGGHFSGRITVALVAAGAIIITALKNKGICIGTHIKQCCDIKDDSMNDINDIELVNKKQFAMLNDSKAAEVLKRIEEVAAQGDSIGGILETVVVGMPAGVGEPWFDSIESLLSHALFSIPAVKGVEFGAGFDFVNMLGSQGNDSFKMVDGKVTTITNNNGGINGGISNGMPIRFSCIIKPTPSIFKPQDTVDFQKMEDSVLQLKGRHDPAIFHRARVVVDSITAIVLADLLAGRFSTDYLAGE